MLPVECMTCYKAIDICYRLSKLPKEISVFLIVIEKKLHWVLFSGLVWLCLWYCVSAGFTNRGFWQQEELLQVSSSCPFYSAEVFSVAPRMHLEFTCAAVWLLTPVAQWTASASDSLSAWLLSGRKDLCLRPTSFSFLSLCRWLQLSLTTNYTRALLSLLYSFYL